MITSLAIYEARLLLVYCSSVFLSFFFSISLLCLFISARTILWPGNFIMLFPPQLAPSLSLFLSLSLVAYRESTRTIEAAQPQNIIGLLSVVIYFQLAYLVGNNRKLG